MINKIFIGGFFGLLVGTAVAMLIILLINILVGPVPIFLCFIVGMLCGGIGTFKGMMGAE